MKTTRKNDKISKVVSFFSGVGKIRNLFGVYLHEVLVDDEDNPSAIVVGFEGDEVEVLFFNERFDFSKQLHRRGKGFSININDAVLGRVLDGKGSPLDDFGEVKGKSFDVFRDAPPIIAREPVTSPLTTGIKIIDTTLPLGRGQRELIIGDHKIGKSTIAIDVVLNQKKAVPPVKCIYVVCGHKEKYIHEIVDLFEKRGALLYTTVVAASSGASFAEKYLAPFVGCAIGEYFRDKGEDALVVFDDLSKHAKTYRDISLLLERAPGREAYPGDIFSLHAELLERSAKLSKRNGGGSLTALPIIETLEGDITSFIPTNLISITDGQIYLERGLFQKGFLPAVNVGLSVSRIGSKAQPRALREVTGGIRVTLTQHKELQKLTQLETTISQEARRNIFRGELTLEMMKQEKHTNVSWPEQTILFYAIEEGFFDDLEMSKNLHFENFLLQLLRTAHHSLVNEIMEGRFDDGTKKAIRAFIAHFKEEFLSEKVIEEKID